MRSRPRDRALLHKPPVGDHDQGRSEHGENEDAAYAQAEPERDGAADDRANDPEQDREPDWHRIRPRHGEPAEAADHEAGDEDGDHVAETHAREVNGKFQPGDSELPRLRATSVAEISAPEDPYE